MDRSTLRFQNSVPRTAVLIRIECTHTDIILRAVTMPKPPNPMPVHRL